MIFHEHSEALEPAAALCRAVLDITVATTSDEITRVGPQLPHFILTSPARLARLEQEGKMHLGKVGWLIVDEFSERDYPSSHCSPAEDVDSVVVLDVSDLMCQLSHLLDVAAL